ncbi:MAG: phosphocholine cytidylyltransferase family protein [Candidatus Eutrophobiaceae bacterium]
MKHPNDLAVVMLAAGLGKRIQRYNKGTPKCLMQVGGRSLLQRHLDIMAKLGISCLHLVVGHAAEMIESSIADSPIKVNLLFNPRYREGSIVSLWTAQAVVAETSMILMDADVIYHSNILANLLRAPKGNWLQFDRDFAPGDEPVKIRMHKDRIVEFHKRPTNLAFDVQGESTGFFRFDRAMTKRLMQRTQDYINEDRADAPHEEAIRDLLLETPESFNCMDISGLPWMEIDFPEDALRAQDLAEQLQEPPPAP